MYLENEPLKEKKKEHYGFLDNLFGKELTFGEQVAQDIEALNEVNEVKGMSKTTKTIIGGAILLVVGFVGFKIYKKVKK